MQPSARKKSQRGIRRSDAPCSESNNQRKAAGTQSMSASNYSERREWRRGEVLLRLERSQTDERNRHGLNTGSVDSARQSFIANEIPAKQGS